MRFIFVIFSLLFFTNLFAHTGHDHAHWSAYLLHALWVTPALIAVILLVRFTLRKKNQ